MTVATPGAPDLVTRFATISTNTWNAEARTFEAVFSTGAPVRRYDGRGAYLELLSISGHRGAEGAPFLDHHRRDSLDAILGTVLSARTVGGEAIATIKLSGHHPQAARLASELGDGNRFGISVGYRVDEWGAERTDPKTGIRSREAVQWTVGEISVVAVPADPAASTRGESNLEPDLIPADQNTTTPPVQTPPPGTQTRAEVNGEIRSIASLSALPQSWIDSQIDASATLEQARAAAFEAMRSRPSATDQIRSTVQVIREHDASDLRLRNMGEALYTRLTPGHQPAEGAGAFAGMTIIDMARETLRLRGVSTAGLNANDLIVRGLHTTSDFPLLLGGTITRTIGEGYRAAPSGLRQVARQTTIRDFKTKYRLQLSGTPALEKVNEAGEFKYGTMTEAGESYRLETFGKIFAISRHALVNDDLGAFADLARKWGQSAAAKEAQFLADIVLDEGGAGPKMSDGKTFFHVDHRNRPATGSALDITGLSAARMSLRRQVGLAGELIDVAPKYLVVPPELETKAEQLVAPITAVASTEINPFSGKLVVVVEPRLTDPKRWYLAADPALNDGLEFAYLESREGVQTDTEAGFEIDGVKVKAQLDFGGGFVDWRSWFMNPGADA
jgi:phage major head subunit gpT-like protein